MCSGLVCSPEEFVSYCSYNFVLISVWMLGKLWCAIELLWVFLCGVLVSTPLICYLHKFVLFWIWCSCYRCFCSVIEGGQGDLKKIGNLTFMRVTLLG